jgi:hypothetical protein
MTTGTHVVEVSGESQPHACTSYYDGYANRSWGSFRRDFLHVIALNPQTTAARLTPNASFAETLEERVIGTAQQLRGLRGPT